MTYEQVVGELESRPVMPDQAPSLNTTREGLNRLGLKFDPNRIIVVAGTNGKGSTCATLEALLLSQGLRVGLYTSPHLIETRERIRLSGEDISETDFCDAYKEVEEKTRDLRLTHFEMLTLMAAFCFQSLDWSIYEVGLGGTWDATNAIPHAVCAITRLGLDHQNILGPTVRDVAANKLGIVTDKAKVFHNPFPTEISDMVNEHRQRFKCHFIESDQFSYEPLFKLKTKWGESVMNLPGLRAAENSVLALKIFEGLGFDPRESLHALSRVRWPGRMERIDGFKCAVFLSGDHNPQGIESLIEILRHYQRAHLHVIAGIGRDKDSDGILRRLFDLPTTSVYLTESPFRGKTIEEYGEWSSRARAISRSPETLFSEIVRTAAPDDMVIVTGSLYLVGLLRKFCKRN